MRLMITGGGTGGHTSPAVAILEELQRRDSLLELMWVGRRGNIEERICESRSIPFRHVGVEGWPRHGRIKKLWMLARLGVNVARCALYIQRFRPQVVVGVGGYVSVPLMFTAQRLGIPTVLHEQNKHLGMANRLLAARATRILLSYPDTTGEYPRHKSRVVGNPVRTDFISPPDKASARAEFELEDVPPVVLASGGSQGAHRLNQAMMDALPTFRAGDAQFIWMTGNADIAAARAVAEKAAVPVRVFPFIEKMAAACAAAELLVSRAGASSTAEIAVMGKPSILVPFPHATDNHQEQNARAFEAADAARVILDRDCTGETLGEAIRSLLSDADRLKKMGHAAHGLARPAAAELIAEEILSLVFEKAG